MKTPTSAPRGLPPGVSSASRLVQTLLRRGVPLGPLRLLETRGRTSGRPASTPVAVVRHAGKEWLVSPFGRMGWVRNYEANAVASLVRGRAERPIGLTEIRDERRAAVLRSYRSSFRLVPFVRRAFTAGPADPLDAFEAEADLHPVFLIEHRPPTTRSSVDRTELAQHNQTVIEEFRRHAGTVGGRYDGMTLLLLHTVGARTGRPRVNPLVYRALADGAYAVFAANGGAPQRPDWYYNLLRQPRVVIEVGDAELTMSARITTGEERDRIWAQQIELLPHFAELAAASKREVPVVVIEPTVPSPTMP
jgi:deazaflavin-dependent oxidoreductase (nitroreductase family)